MPLAQPLPPLRGRGALEPTAPPMGRRGTGSGKKGGGKPDKDHAHHGRCVINKNRWDDIVQKELKPENIARVVAEKTKLDEDKPGLGQYYCLSCAKYCISQRALDDHNESKKHKRRLKMLVTTKPYSHAEALAGSGKGATDNGQVSGVKLGSGPQAMES